MTAQEYFESYRNVMFVSAEGLYVEATRLLGDLSEELTQLYKEDKIPNRKAMLKILKEQNDKWNAIVALFRENYNGMSPIAPNAFKRHYIRHIPELKAVWK